MGSFGKRLKKEREKKGFNQKEFAKAIGVTPTRLNYWEKNKREPDFPNIRKIIDILECDADYLLGTKYGSATNGESFLFTGNIQFQKGLMALPPEKQEEALRYIEYLIFRENRLEENKKEDRP